MFLIHITYRKSQLHLAYLQCAQNTQISLEMTNYLEFCLLLLTRVADTDGCFVDVMGRKNMKHNIQTPLATQHTVEQPLFTLVTTRLPLPSITREYHATHHQPGKGSKFKIQSMVSTEIVQLSHQWKHKKKKIVKSNCPSKQETICTYLLIFIFSTQHNAQHLPDIKQICTQ